jgi:hypothetical protein
MESYARIAAKNAPPPEQQVRSLLVLSSAYSTRLVEPFHLAPP